MAQERKIAVLLLLSCWAVVSALFFHAWHLPNMNTDGFFNADVVSSYYLALDLANDPRALFSWDLPPANYLFVEQMFLVPLALAGLRFDQAAPLYASLMMLVLLAGQYAFASRFLRRLPSAVAVITGFSFLAYPLLLGVYPVRALVTPNFHGSIFVLLPGLLATCVLVLQGGCRYERLALAALFVLTFLSSFSDRLFGVCFIAPTILAILAVHVADPRVRQRVFCLAAVIVVASAAGMGLDFWWRPNNPGAVVAPELVQFLDNCREMWRFTDDLRRNSPFSFYLVFATPVVSLVFLMWHAILPAEPPGAASAIFAAAFGVIYTPFFQLVHAASTLEPVLHYRVGDLVVAATLLPIILALSWRRPLPNGIAALYCLLAIAGVSGLALTALPQRSMGTPQVMTLVTCLDDLHLKYGVSYGAGDYWQATPVRPLSKYGMEAISVGPDLKPRPWNQTRVIEGDRQFEFVIVDKTMNPAVLDPFRKSAVSESCDGREVLLRK